MEFAPEVIIEFGKGIKKTSSAAINF